MNRKEFLKTIGIAGIVVVSGQFGNRSLVFAGSNDKLKNWAWITTDINKPVDEWKKAFAKMKQAGIDAVIPEIFNGRFAFYASKHLLVKDEWLERLIPLAKEEGLEVHAWMWTMICNMEKIFTEHPEWYIVNGNGESILKKPAYAPWYKFLCPSREDAKEFITERVKELAEYDQIDGIHLDYIRYPEVIIAESLQKKYGIVQDKEYLEYDYCYCEVCQKTFREKTGIDVKKLDDPTTNMEWRQYRFDTITNLINNKINPIAKKHNKALTAAVFPPYIKVYVRQQWENWNLDAVHPMLYNTFYNKGIDWINEQTKIGTKSLKNSAPLYSGLFIPELNPEQLSQAIEASLSGGAKGIVLFSGNRMSDEQWESFSKTLAMYK